jgi:hypothetical protein
VCYGIFSWNVSESLGVLHQWLQTDWYVLFKCIFMCPSWIPVVVKSVKQQSFEQDRPLLQTALILWMVFHISRDNYQWMKWVRPPTVPNAKGISSQKVKYTIFDFGMRKTRVFSISRGIGVYSANSRKSLP